MALEIVTPYLVSAEDRYFAHPQHPEHTPAEAVVFLNYRHVEGRLRGQMKGPWPLELATAPVALANVNHGRWSVGCPFPPCNSSQYASRADRRFFCTDCGNGGTGQWVEVQWPSELDAIAITNLLGIRPDVTLRNWEPGEPVSHLEDENKAAGLA